LVAKKFRFLKLVQEKIVLKEALVVVVTVAVATEVATAAEAVINQFRI